MANTENHKCWLFEKGQERATKQIPGTKFYVHAVREADPRISEKKRCNVEASIEHTEVFKPGFTGSSGGGYCSGCSSLVNISINSSPNNTLISIEESRAKDREALNNLLRSYKNP